MKIRVKSFYHNKTFVYEGTFKDWAKFLDCHIEDGDMNTLLTAIGLEFHGTASIAKRIGKSKLVKVSTLIKESA